MRCGIALGALSAGLLLTSCGGDDYATLDPAEACPGASVAEDEAGDSPEDFLDLRRFELSATEAGVCVRWTTDARAPVGTTLFFGAHGPSQTSPSGYGSVNYGYGFDVELLEDGAEVTYGLGDVTKETPNFLKARVGQSGNTVSTFVPRSELDRPPANTPHRPPFPYTAFTAYARVKDAVTEDIADMWPQESPDEASYVNGKFCEPLCPPSPLDPPARLIP